MNGYRLCLQQLVTHDQERRSDARAKEGDEDGGQLVLVVDGERQVLSVVKEQKILLKRCSHVKVSARRTRMQRQ